MTANHEAKLTPTTARLLVEALNSLLTEYREVRADNGYFKKDPLCFRSVSEALSAAERELEGK